MDFVKGEYIYFKNIWSIAIQEAIFEMPLNNNQVLVKNEEERFTVIDSANILSREDGAEFFSLCNKKEKLEKQLKQVEDRIQQIEGKL